ncbi:MAG: hypothetical protein K6B41_03415 [Butyrivibrio sp.]|nr:hypothetical protein [Butyrivibrio sp.]
MVIYSRYFHTHMSVDDYIKKCFVYNDSVLDDQVKFLKNIELSFEGQGDAQYLFDSMIYPTMQFCDNRIRYIDSTISLMNATCLLAAKNSTKRAFPEVYRWKRTKSLTVL